MVGWARGVGWPKPLSDTPPPMLRLLLLLVSCCCSAGRGMPERREYSPLNPLGLPLDGRGRVQAPPPPPPRPNNNPNANNGPDGPGPCGARSSPHRFSPYPPALTRASA